MQPRSYEPRALPLELPRLSLLRLTSSLTIDRRLESNQRPRKVLMHPPPRAYRLRHTGLQVCSSALMHRCDVKNITGEMIRTPALGIMSPARYLCATPVGVPPDGFDPSTPGL